MNEFLSGLSGLFLPALLGVILLHGFLKKAPVYDLFVEGCRDRDQIGGGDYAVYHRGFSGDSDYDGFRSSRAFGEAVRTDSGASGDTEGTDLFYDHASRLRQRHSGDHRKYRSDVRTGQFFMPLCFGYDGEQRDFALCCSRLFRGDAGILAAPHHTRGSGGICGRNLAVYRLMQNNVGKY